MAAKNTISVRLDGISTVVSALNTELERLKGPKATQAFIRASILLQREMSLTSPTIPLDLSNLRHSFFAIATRKNVDIGGRFKGGDAGKLQSEHSSTISAAKSYVSMSRYPMMIIGFSAYYAAIVHEMRENVDWNEPGSGPKFFEAAFNRNRDNLLKIFKEESEL